MTKKGSQIALLGTSADPPTLGHQALLEGLLELFPKVITWASNNPMKKHRAPLDKRKHFLLTLVKAINNPNLELKQELSSPWSIVTLEKALNLWPNKELIFVIGSDLAEQLPQWAKADVFLKKARIGIAPRDGWPISKNVLIKIKKLGGRVDLLPLQIPASASSEILSQDKSCQIPQAVFRAIIQENLYGLADQ